MGVAHAAAPLVCAPSSSSSSSSLIFPTINITISPPTQRQLRILLRLLLKNLIVVLLVLLLSSSCSRTFGVEVKSTRMASESDTLLKFKESLSNADDALGSWNPSTRPCSGNYGNWVGVLCWGGNVWGLQLEKMSLTGEIDLDSLYLMPHLRTLSFMKNKFEGPIPNIKKLGSLKSLFLSNNQFSGQIPNDTFTGMGSLKKLFLSNNKFTGTIPTSLAELPKLLELTLDGNQFEGRMPNFQHKDLKLLNVSNNQLEGPIPANLINLSPTLFSGNKDLCGKPLDSVCKPEVENLPNYSDATTPNDSPLKIAIIVICCGVALAAIIAVLIIICRHRSTQTPQLGRAGSSYNAAVASNAAATHVIKNPVEGSSLVAETTSGVNCTVNKKADHSKLSFVRDDRQRFDLQDLLRASAEVLGSGNFGSSYKAVLMDGQAVVVKRFKQMNSVGREEFHEHMRRLGRLTHPNLLPLVAYYYRKEEKLLVFDHVHNGSLARNLHGNHTVDEPGLDWPTRLKIVKGVARGLAYLHNELPSLIVPHGHLKSSNVLLDESFEPHLMDYTLVPVVNPEHAHQILVAYKSPEYALHGRTTKKTDIWSLGILILEILTGKFPANYLAQGTGRNAGAAADSASWVDSIVRDHQQSTSTVQVLFDKEMGRTNNSEGQMLKLFEIGVACCEEDVSKRWDLKEVVEKIEELKERDTDCPVVDHRV